MARLPGVLATSCACRRRGSSRRRSSCPGRGSSKAVRDALPRAVPVGRAPARHRRRSSSDIPLDPIASERRGARRGSSPASSTLGRRPGAAPVGHRRIRCSPTSTCAISRPACPRADVHRFVGASHLVAEDADVAGAVHEWVAQLRPCRRADRDAARGAGIRAPAWAGLDRRSGRHRRRDDRDDRARVRVGRSRSPSSTPTCGAWRPDSSRTAWRGRSCRAADPARASTSRCACTRAGAWARSSWSSTPASGPRHRPGAQERGAALPDRHPARARRGARSSGGRAGASPPDRCHAAAARRARRLDHARRDPRARRRAARCRRRRPTPIPAAVVFTSGATGPAKGVAYRHRQLQAQRDVLARLYDITDDDRFVAAFAPFALYGPAMGVPSVVPDMDVTAPGTLRAVALADAAAAIDAIARVRVAGRARQRDRHRRRSHAAPSRRRSPASGCSCRPARRSRARCSRAVAELMPNAEAHTPYGMTEVLPVTDITPAEIDARRRGQRRLRRPAARRGRRSRSARSTPRATPPARSRPRPVSSGEVCIQAAHAKDGYDKLWLTQHRSERAGGWHRSGDVGHLDADGRLWIEGRLIHVITTANGPGDPGRDRAGGRGGRRASARPPRSGSGRPGPSRSWWSSSRPTTTAPARPRARARSRHAVRAVAGVDVAAVLVVPALPVDMRHNSKIDRTRVGEWASAVLAGGRMRGL